MRENGIKSVHYRLQFFWPGTLFSLAAVLKICWNRLFFMSINGLFSWIHEGMLAFWRGLRGYCAVLSQGPSDLCSKFAHSIILRLKWYGEPAVYALSWCLSKGLAKVLQTGTTGVAMRGVSELLPVSESWWVRERRRQQIAGKWSKAAGRQPHMFYSWIILFYTWANVSHKTQKNREVLKGPSSVSVVLRNCTKKA